MLVQHYPKSVFPLFILISWMIIVVACQSQNEGESPIVTMANTALPPTIIPPASPSLTPTPTETPLPTFTSTTTLTPLPTFTPTPTLTPTPAIPEKTLIAFVVSMRNSRGYSSLGNLWIINPTNGEHYALTTGNNDSQPAWSPSGKKLAYIRNEVDDRGRIVEGGLYIINSDGTGEQLVKQGTRIHYPQWLSENAILFTEIINPGTGEYGGDLFIITLPTGKIESFTIEGVSKVSSFQVSFDRQLIAFTDFSNAELHEGVGFVNTPLRIASLDGKIVADIYIQNGVVAQAHIGTWHPNGEQFIMYDATFARTRLSNCFLGYLDATPARGISRVSDAEAECRFSFSPDGVWLATVFPVASDVVGIGNVIGLRPWATMLDLKVIPENRVFSLDIEGDFAIWDVTWSPFITEN